MKSAAIKVDYIDHMGDDLRVVNAARVSFDKASDELHEKDERLIRYLAEYNHWSPFSHCFLSLRIKAPIFVARQLVKHQVGLAWNEVSRRYVDSEPEFWFPNEWRGRPINAKQGSSDEVITHINFKGSVESWEDEIDNLVALSIESTVNLYNSMIEGGVAPEQARMILPLNTMTEWYWSGSLFAFARVCNLRLDDHAQLETAEVAYKIYEIMQEYFPIATKELVNV